MRGLLITICTLVFSVAFAQETTQPAPAKKADEKNVWVEVNIPWSRNGGFGDAQGDSKTDSFSIYSPGFTIGWEPYVNNPSQGWFVSAFRNVGFTFNVTTNSNSPNELYDEYLGSIYEVVPQWKIPTTCGGQYGGGEQCVSCGTDGIGLVQTCTVENIYGRFTPIKYSRGSAAVGMYVPKKFGKLLVQAGVNARLHLTKEGQLSNDLTNSSETSFAGTIRVAYPIKDNMSISAGYEHSFSGSKSGPSRFKYKAYTFGASIRW